MSKKVGITKAAKDALTKNIFTQDGYTNFTAKLGLGTDNLSSKSSYTLTNLLTRDRQKLEVIYRHSWIAGQVVDTVAEDMTKEGISMVSSSSPDDIQKLQSEITRLAIWKNIGRGEKWGRLYGGAIAIMLIDGANYEEPLRLDSIGKNSFKGLLVFDRWQIDPSFNDLITEICPDMGKPKYYTIMAGIESMSGQRIHYSRIIRFDGIEMPYNQKRVDNFWGMSVIERLYDRLVAFDSATAGAAQLLYKAYLRVIQVDGLR